MVVPSAAGSSEGGGGVGVEPLSTNGVQTVATLHERLYEAAVAGKADAIPQLCRLGAKMEPDSEGRTPLHMACANGFVDAARALILQSAKINATDQSGYTALHHAASEGHVEVIRLLLKHHAVVDLHEDMHGNTALHEASWRGYSHSVELLCRSRANVYAKNKSGFTPLHLACQNGHNQTTRYLLLAGCKPDVKNNYGDSPLHTAARYGHAGVVRILVSAFCNASDINKNGDTALHITAAMGRRKLTRILLEAGCDQTIKNQQNETPQDIARRKDHGEVEEILLHPPPRISPEEHLNRSTSGEHKKRAKDSNTSQETTSSKPCCSKNKERHKKTKNGATVTSSSGPGLGSHPPGVLCSPYGCNHHSPNMSSFPTPKLDTMPEEPLTKGEQYYLDLAGNIKKGPVGKDYTCFCAPFFHNVEKKLEADKQELQEQIDAQHDDLEAKIAHLERRTRNQLHHLNRSVSEKIDKEREQCVETVQTAVTKEREELEKREEELRAFVESLTRSPFTRSSPQGQSFTGTNAKQAEEARWSNLLRRSSAIANQQASEGGGPLNTSIQSNQADSSPNTSSGIHDVSGETLNRTISANDIGLPPAPPLPLSTKPSTSTTYPLWDPPSVIREPAVGQSPTHDDYSSTTTGGSSKAGPSPPTLDGALASSSPLFPNCSSLSATPENVPTTSELKSIIRGSPIQSPSKRPPHPPPYNAALQRVQSSSLLNNNPHLPHQSSPLVDRNRAIAPIGNIPPSRPTSAPYNDVETQLGRFNEGLDINGGFCSSSEV